MHRAILSFVLICAPVACAAEPVTDDEEGSSSSNPSATTGAGASGAGASGPGPTTGVGGNTGCVAHTDCPADQICLDAACNVAWNRVFRFIVVSGVAPTSGNPNNGLDWDVGGGAPDPFVEIVDTDVPIGVTSVQQDTFTPSWNEQIEIVLQATGGEISFRMWDEDVTTDDWMTGFDGVPAFWLQTVRETAGSYTWSKDGMQITVLVQPQ